MKLFTENLNRNVFMPHVLIKLSVFLALNIVPIAYTQLFLSHGGMAEEDN